MTGCNRPAGREDGWVRYDLRRNPPQVDTGRVSQEMAFLGEPTGSPNAKRRGGPQVAALKVAANAEMRWTVQLGQEPLLSFIPLERRRRGCTLRYRVDIENGGQRERVFWVGGKHSRFGSATVELPLDDYSGKKVDLFLSTLGTNPSCTKVEAIWGNPAIWSRGSTPPPVGSSDQPNVLLIALDTFRADYIGAYGRQPSPSPTLDALAAESDLYLQAFSTFNITNPSFASIMTGLFGKNHGVYDFGTPLPKEQTTLAELFKNDGYETAAVISVRHLRAVQSGLGQGFDHVDYSTRQFAAEYVIDEGIEWLSERQRPFFLWLHFFDPHVPLTPPRPYTRGFVAHDPGIGRPEDWREQRPPDDPKLGDYLKLYPSEVAYLDRQIGRMMDFLDSRGLLETTIIAVVADHGENLGEHGIECQHNGLWDTTTHVPLMIRWPGPRDPSRGRRISDLVQTIDLYPTLANAAGVGEPELMEDRDGRDLRSDGRRRAVFAETGKGGIMVRTADYLFFRSIDDPYVADGHYLFDLAADPDQEINLAGRGLTVEAEMAAYADNWLAAGRSTAQAIELSEEDLEDLRALGYLDP